MMTLGLWHCNDGLVQYCSNCSMLSHRYNVHQATRRSGKNKTNDLYVIWKTVMFFTGFCAVKAPVEFSKHCYRSTQASFYKSVDIMFLSVFKKIFYCLDMWWPEKSTSLTWLYCFVWAKTMQWRHMSILVSKITGDSTLFKCFFRLTMLETLKPNNWPFVRGIHGLPVMQEAFSCDDIIIMEIRVSGTQIMQIP